MMNYSRFLLACSTSECSKVYRHYGDIVSMYMAKCVSKEHPITFHWRTLDLSQFVVLGRR